jgi:hypothetical protein
MKFQSDSGSVESHRKPNAADGGGGGEEEIGAGKVKQFHELCKCRKTSKRLQ